MDETTSTASGIEGAVNAAVNAEEAPASTGSASTPEGNADGVTATPTVEDFEKVDPTKLSPDQLKVYKHWQKHFTKSTQEYKGKIGEYEKQVSAFKALMENPDVYAYAYRSQYGKFPEGYEGTPVAGKSDSLINATDEAIDPTVKKLADEVNLLKQEVDLRKQQEQKDTVAKYQSEIDAFEKELFKNPDHKALYEEKREDIEKTAIALHSKGYDTQTSLKKAFVAETSDKLEELTKKKVWAEIEQKADKKRPEVNMVQGKTVGTGKRGLDAILSEALENAEAK